MEDTIIKQFSLKKAFLFFFFTGHKYALISCELHVVAANTQRLHWGPKFKRVSLWPNPAFLPKILMLLISSNLSGLADKSMPRTALGSEALY